VTTKSIETISGISFYSNRQECIERFKKTHWAQKVYGVLSSFGNFFKHCACKAHLRFKGDAKIQELSKDRQFSKKRLVVCLHGLGDSPLQFKKITEHMQKVDDTDIYTPWILNKGSAALDKMVQPIFEQISKWNCEGDKELVLIGISNGARIARALEAKIACENMSIKKLKFISIVGACQGSSLVDLAKKCHLSWLLRKNIAEEMPKDSARSQQLNKDWRGALSQGPQKEHTFIAAAQDWIVPNHDSSLLDGVEGARYAIVPNHGHNSAVNAVAAAVATIACDSLHDKND
jgi:hypothetical protein